MRLERTVLLLALFCLSPRIGSALQGQGTPSPGKVHASPDGRLRWLEGDSFILVSDAPGEKPRRVPLPADKEKPASREILFAEHGGWFCLLDAHDSEFGLHLDLRRGGKDAKALLLRSTLKLVDDHGKVLWTREMPDKVAVSKPAREARALRISDNGTLAILLQDVDPYEKARPLLLAIDPAGKELLRLDYLAWTKISDFSLSSDGKSLTVRGFGHLPEEESWADAVGVYDTGSGKGRLRRAEAGR